MIQVLELDDVITETADEIADMMGNQELYQFKHESRGARQTQQAQV